MTAMTMPNERERRFLQPGHLLVSATPLSVTTILGSCVTVCLWDPQKKVGGLNHFMLPILAGSITASARFGNVAMDELLEKMRAAGARLPFLQARVFGGACMFTQMQSESHLGAKNAEFALNYLTRRAIEVLQVDVGGNRGRKLIFDTETGAACLNQI